jgi:hypothetical protein
MNNNIEDRFKINFQNEAVNLSNSKLLKDIKKVQEHDKIKTEYVNAFKLNKYSRIVMLIGNCIIFHKMMKTKSKEYIKIMVIFNSFAYLCGMMANLK